MDRSTERGRRVVVPLAEGFEEIEAVVVVDVLRRAGLEVVTAGVGVPEDPGEVTGSHGITVRCDAPFGAVAAEPGAVDALVLPGGIPGTPNLAADPRVADLARRLADRGALVAAICAAPTVLDAAGVLDGRRVACHPRHHDEIRRGRVVEEDVAVDGPVVTGRGAGTALAFASELVRRLVDDATADAILEAIQYRRSG